MRSVFGGDARTDMGTDDCDYELCEFGERERGQTYIQREREREKHREREREREREIETHTHHACEVFGSFAAVDDRELCGLSSCQSFLLSHDSLSLSLYLSIYLSISLSIYLSMYL